MPKAPNKEEQTISLPTLVGHEDVRESLRTLSKSGKMPHALMFYGPKGIGKRAVADHMAWSLIAGAGDEGDNILGHNGQSNEAAQLKAGASPNYHVLCPSENRRNITVDDVRRILERISLSSDGWRIVIVDSADELNEASANAILKTLEEPQPGVLLILLSNNLSKLLPTIVSRCRKFRFSPLSAEHVRTVLKQEGEDNPDAVILGVSGGSAGTATELMKKGENVVKVLPAFFDDLAAGSQITNPADYAQKMLTKSDYLICSEFLLWWLAACARQAGGFTDSQLQSDLSEQLTKHSKLLSALAWGRLYKDVAKLTAEQTEFNLPATASLETALQMIINALNTAKAA